MSDSFLAVAQRRAADASSSFADAPALIAWFGVGNTKQQSIAALEPLLSSARAAGLVDHSVLFLAHEYPCNTWAEYVDALVKEIDAAWPNRPLFLVGFSAGSLAAYSVAVRLGARVRKVCVCAIRPAFNVSADAPPHGDSAFGVSSPEAFRALADEKVFEGMANAWVPNLKRFVALKKPYTEMPSALRSMVEHFRQLMGLPFYPAWTSTVSLAYGTNPGPKMVAPLLVLAATSEEPHAEVPARMGGWRQLTAASCELHAIDGVDHMGLLAQRDGEAVQLIVKWLVQS